MLSSKNLNVNLYKNKLFGFIFFVLQIALLFVVIDKLNLETDTNLQKLLPIIGVGFTIHYWLPLKFKLPFFVLTSFASIIGILGLYYGLILISIGFIILISCHLPIKFYYKTILVGFITLCLILFRAHIFKIEPIPAIIPFIGTMFMLRLILYLYEIKFDDSTKNSWHRIAYFFLAPNVCFPLFPLIDFKNLIKTYYNRPDDEIYSLGIRRIYRGVMHLISYRIIYYFLIPDPTDIHDLYSIIHFIILSYTLILRLSGMFHISLGILSLFGFNLPEIFNNYFYASSFNNIWRRINIYWREALMKIFYYPIYFEIRKINKQYTVPITILILFVINWLLHGYQWFWIRGSFPLAANDFLFWIIFGFAVMLNSIYLQKERKPKKLHPTNDETFKMVLLKIIKPIGMFFFMCSIWMMWSSTSLTEWFYLLSFFTKGSLHEWLIVFGVIVLIFGIILILYYSFNNGILKRVLLFYNNNIPFITLILIIILCAFSFPQISSNIIIDQQPLSFYLEKNDLNKKDKKTMERGYYQKLLTDNNNNSLKFWGAQVSQPKNWNVNRAYIKTDNILRKKFGKNKSTIYKTKQLTTNSFGLRDKEYTLEKDPETYRIALLGGSYEMGAGVNDNENFESVTETLLNEKLEQPIEILNFAVGGYHLIENVYLIQHSVFNFNPDAVIYTAHSNEFYRLQSRFIDLIEEKTTVTDSTLKFIIDQSGVAPDMCRLELQNRLNPFMIDLVTWGYTTIAKECEEHHAKPIWLYLPAVADDIDEDYDQILSIAQQAGFIIISLDDVYNGVDNNELQIAIWDTHPNKKGHSLIAHELYKELLLNSKKLELKNKQ